MFYRTLRTKEFCEWMAQEPLKAQVQIEKRIALVELEGHFGTINSVGDAVFEFKWQNGRRVYYTYLEEQNILLLLGGNKNGQDYDISQAKKILKKYVEDETNA